MLFISGCSNDEDALPDEENSGTELALEQTYELSRDFFSRFQKETDNDFSELQQQLYQQAGGDSLHPSFLVARIHESMLYNLNQQYEPSFEIIHDVYQKADSLGLEAVKVRSIPALSWLHRFNGNTEKAIRLIDEGLAIVDADEDPLVYLMLLQNQGQTLSEVGQFNKALNVYYEVADKHEERNDLFRLSYTYGSIALLFSDIGNYEESLKWHEKALEIQEETGDLIGKSRSFNNMAIVYNEKEQHQKAIDIYEQALAIDHELNQPVDIIRSTYNIGNAYYKLEDYEQAIRKYEQGLQLSQEGNVIPGIMYNKMGLGITYKQLGEDETALSYLAEAERLGGQMSNKGVLSNTYEARYELARQQVDSEVALSYYEKFTELSDEFNELARNRALDELIIEHNVETTRAENEFLAETVALQKDLSRNKTAAIAFLGFIVLISMGFTYYFFQTRRKLQHAYASLDKQKQNVARQHEELQQVSKERQAFLHIIVHDLRNPLSAFSGTLELLQMEKKRENNELLQIMEQSANRMHLLINSLLQIFERENMEVKKTPVIISELMQKTVDEHRSHANQKNITISTSLPDFEVATHADSIENIASNLLSNAIKYTPENKRVELSIQRHRNSWELLVCDEGPGFTQEDRKHVFKLFARLSARPTAGEPSSGVGLYSVKMLVKRLDGEIELLQASDGGAAFRCTFPVCEADKTDAAGTALHADPKAAHEKAKKLRQPANYA
ncbi:MAG: tetratricopeptide repeat protein [Cyclonatronaceae bacterium]